MFRFLVFLLVVLGLAILFAWVADNPGTIFLQWEWLAQKMGRPGEEVGVPLTLAFSLLVGLIFLIMLGWGILRGIIGAPTMLSKFFDNRKREKGYKALSQGLIAASSGDASTARKLTKESKKLLGQDPLVALLGTQTAILEGKRDEARENFKTMLEDEYHQNGCTSRFLSKEAHKLARDLVPAATTFARVSTRLGDPKTATKILEASWKEAPHPELAEAHSAVSSGESVQERLERAKNLSKLKPKDPEGNLALAIAAIDANEWDQARKHWNLF
ncbi:hypothetical protein GQR58_004281 [Nymphon striatum]|nr:hypothetical protein GQR58_004281 [Nymphon striatum]